MKKIICILSCVLGTMLVGLTTSTFASTDTDSGHTVSMNYMLGDWNSLGTSVDQKYFPMITGIFSVADKWKVEAEYMDSSTETASDGTQVESNRYFFAVRYVYSSDAANSGEGYVSLGYAKFENDLRDISANLHASMEANGLRLGMGYEGVFENSNWSGCFEIGRGISNDGSLSTLGVSASSSVETTDGKLNFSYKFPSQKGLIGNIGYKYQTYDYDFAGTSIKVKIKGPFIGMGFNFN